MMSYMLKAAISCTTIAVLLFAQGVATSASAELVIDVTFLDGRTLTVHQAEILEQSNPGYVPARYALADRIVFHRSTTSLGVTQTEKKHLFTQSIRAIQYVKNKLNWCLVLVSLADGTVLALEEGRTPFTLDGPAFVLERLSDENRRELGRLQLSKGFAGYQADTYGLKFEGKSAKNTFSAENLFNCPRVADDPGPWVGIRSIDLHWKK